MLPDNYGDNPWSAQVAASGGGLGAILAKLFGGGQSAPQSGLPTSAPLPPPRPAEFSGAPNPGSPSSGMPSEGLLPPPSYQPSLPGSSLPTMAGAGFSGLTGIGRTPPGVPSMTARKGQLIFPGRR